MHVTLLRVHAYRCQTPHLECPDAVTNSSSHSRPPANPAFTPSRSSQPCPGSGSVQGTPKHLAHKSSNSLLLYTESKEVASKWANEPAPFPRLPHATVHSRTPSLPHSLRLPTGQPAGSSPVITQGHQGPSRASCLPAPQSTQAASPSEHPPPHSSPALWDQRAVFPSHAWARAHHVRLTPVRQVPRVRLQSSRSNTYPLAGEEFGGFYL